jgi:uncharacterized protein (TIGR02266 family)
MAEERRSAARARISGVRVTYQSAAGDPFETDALNVGRGGLFVRAAKPLAVGKRIALELQVVGELVPWSALGRVVWTREHDEGERRPPGMGVKLIDVEDAVLLAIERLVAGREHTEPGVWEEEAATPEPNRRGVAPSTDGPGAPAPPGRGPTIEAAHAAPLVPAPSRERTILGVGGAAFPAAEPVAAPERSPSRTPSVAREPSVSREPSVAIDLVGKGGTSAVSPQRSPYEAEERSPPTPHPQVARPASDTPPAIKRRGGGRWVVVLLVLAVAAVAAYMLLDGDLERLVHPSEPAALTNPPAPPPPTPTPAATATLAPTPTATATASATASASASGASGVPRKAPSASPSPPLSPAPGPPRKPAAVDNPY